MDGYFKRSMGGRIDPEGCPGELSEKMEADSAAKRDHNGLGEPGPCRLVQPGVRMGGHSKSGATSQERDHFQSGVRTKKGEDLREPSGFKSSCRGPPFTDGVDKKRPKAFQRRRILIEDRYRKVLLVRKVAAKSSKIFQICAQRRENGMVCTSIRLRKFNASYASPSATSNGPNHRNGCSNSEMGRRHCAIPGDNRGSRKRTSKEGDRFAEKIGLYHKSGEVVTVIGEDSRLPRLHLVDSGHDDFSPRREATVNQADSSSAAVRDEGDPKDDCCNHRKITILRSSAETVTLLYCGNIHFPQENFESWRMGYDVRMGRTSCQGVKGPVHSLCLSARQDVSLRSARSRGRCRPLRFWLSPSIEDSRNVARHSNQEKFKLPRIINLLDIHSDIQRADKAKNVGIPNRFQGGGVVHKQNSRENCDIVKDGSQRLDDSHGNRVVCSSQSGRSGDNRNVGLVVQDQNIRASNVQGIFRRRMQEVGCGTSLSRGDERAFHIRDLDPSFTVEGLNEEAQRLIWDAKEDKGYSRAIGPVMDFIDDVVAKGKSTFTIIDIINFLAKRKDILVSKTALSTALRMSTGVNITEDYRMIKFTSGVAVNHPKMPKFETMWDMKILFRWLRTDFWADRPGLKLRTKANVLLRCSVAARNGDAAHIHRDLRWSNESVSFRFFKWKTQRSENLAFSRWYVVKKLPPNKAYRCAYTALREYMEYYKDYFEKTPMTQPFIWLDYSGSHPVKPQALATCTTQLLREAGVKAPFGSSTIRHAMISYWRSKGLSPQQCIDRTGQKSLSLIEKFYDLADREVDLNAIIESDDDDVGDDVFGE